MYLKWSTTAFAPEERPEAFERRITHGTAVPLGLARKPHEDISASLRLKAFDGHVLFDFRGDPVDGLHLRRSTGEIQRTEGDYLCVVHPVDAPQGFNFGGREFTLAPGDFSVYDSESAWNLLILRGFRNIILYFPTHMLCTVMPHARDSIGRPINGTRGAGALFTGHLRNLVRQMSRLDEDGLAGVMQATADLFAHAAGASVKLSPRTMRTVMLERVRRYVSAHLPESDLTPRRIAEALRISPRYLHLLFEPTGTSVGAWIRRQRLERCRQDLARSAPHGRTITEIAYSWGFNDSSHFAKAFRKEYDLSPRDYRAQALSKRGEDR